MKWTKNEDSPFSESDVKEAAQQFYLIDMDNDVHKLVNENYALGQKNSVVTPHLNVMFYLFLDFLNECFHSSS